MIKFGADRPHQDGDVTLATETVAAAYHTLSNLTTRSGFHFGQSNVIFSQTKFYAHESPRMAFFFMKN